MALDDYNCVFCSLQTEETLIHLFLDCSFSATCWATLGLFIHNLVDPFATLESFKLQIQQPFFMEIIVTMCWSIWSLGMMQSSGMFNPQFKAASLFSEENLLKLFFERRIV
jgi:hypothetical protein